MAKKQNYAILVYELKRLAIHGPPFFLVGFTARFFKQLVDLLVFIAAKVCTGFRLKLRAVAPIGVGQKKDGNCISRYNGGLC